MEEQEIQDTKKRKKKKRKKKHRFFWFMIKLQIFLMLIVLAGVGYYYYGGYAQEVKRLKEEAVELVSNTDDKIFIPSQTSSVYDADRNLISEKKGSKEADYVVYQDIPPQYISTIISIEDKKFYSHNGIDIKAVFRAALALIENKKITQGGSTITMQLGKLMYMEQGKDWQYKVKQMFIATELEKRYSKDRILEYYLNNIYFANGYYGIKAACRGYFDCELDQLDISHIAFLLAIPNSPSYYDPVVNIENTIERRNLILRNLLDDKKISQAEYESAVKEDIVLNRPDTPAALWNNYVDTYAYHCATLAMMENSGFEIKYYFDSEEEEQEYDLDYDELYSSYQKQLYTGGYKIYTSIEMDKQNALQEALDDTLSEFTEVAENGVYALQGASVCIDNSTGYVVAIVGGRSQDFSSHTLNRAYQSHRQPGSSIKPLNVYTPVFERGYTPDSVANDHEFEGGPKNSSGVYHGEVTLRFAVEQSLNTVPWQLYEELTPEVGLQYLKNMNFTNIVDSDYVIPTSIGGFTTGVSPLEMAAAYATLEHDGMYRNPTCVRAIVDSDENIVCASEQLEKVIYKKSAARMMTDVLASTMTEGLGVNLQLTDMPSTGKSGTTNDSKDGWFVGFTRYYTTSVWVGYDMPRSLVGLNGGSYPGKIWQTFMEKIHTGLAPLEFLPYAQLSQEFQDQQQQQEQENQQFLQDLTDRWQEQENQNNTPQGGQNQEDNPPQEDPNGGQQGENQPEPPDGGQQGEGNPPDNATPENPGGQQGAEQPGTPPQETPGGEQQGNGNTPENPQPEAPVG